MKSKKALKFLDQIMMNVDKIDFIHESNQFTKEMDKGLQANNDSSLGMLPAYIDIENLKEDDSTVLVIDAGGTNFRTALVTLRNGKPSITDFEKNKMPGTEGAIDVETFFSIIADRIESKVDKADAIGFCFSYPAEIMPNGDGKAMHLSKEVTVSGIEGRLLGEGINNELKKRNKKALDVIVINDTVASLLGGIAENKGFDTYIGFILGTGTNLAYSENNESITKVETPEKGTMVINAESGCYANFPKSECDVEHFQNTKEPDMYQAEKVMSGAYLGTLGLIVLKKAAQQNLFTGETCQSILAITSLETKDLGALIENEEGILAESANTQEDKDCIYEIVDGIIERSAMFSAIALASVVFKLNLEESASVCIAAEGTTFNKLANYRERVISYLDKQLTQENGITFKVVSVEDATLVGSAVAAMCQ